VISATACTRLPDSQLDNSWWNFERGVTSRSLSTVLLSSDVVISSDVGDGNAAVSDITIAMRIRIVLRYAANELRLP
jgi:hypothetical protein